MRLVIRSIHPASSTNSGRNGGKNPALNDEWFVIENPGDRPFSTGGCTVSIGRGRGRLRNLGPIDPGFTLQPTGRMRVITGNPGKKAHGPPPEATQELPSYHLFLAEPLFAPPNASGPVVIAISLKQHEIARATFDPDAPDGVAPTPVPSKEEEGP